MHIRTIASTLGHYWGTVGAIKVELLSGPVETDYLKSEVVPFLQFLYRASTEPIEGITSTQITKATQDYLSALYQAGSTLDYSNTQEVLAYLQDALSLKLTS